MALLAPRAFAVVVVVASSMLIGPLATSGHAQDAGPETARTVLDLVKRANDAFDASNFADALALYQEAYDLYPDAVLLYRIALSADNLGEVPRAIEAYEAFAAAKSEEAAAEKSLERAAELRATLPGTLTVTSTPEGASVVIAGATVGVTPLQLQVAPGVVEVTFALAGYDEETRSLTMEGGGEQSLDAQLTASASPEAPVASSPRESSSLATYGWIASGVGVALLGTGVAFAVLTTDAVNDVNDYDKRAASASRDEYESFIDKAKSRHSTAVGFIVAGSVVTAAGVTLILVDMLGNDGKTAWVPNLGVTGDGAFVGVTTRF